MNVEYFFKKNPKQMHVLLLNQSHIKHPPLFYSLGVYDRFQEREIFQDNSDPAGNLIGFSFYFSYFRIKRHCLDTANIFALIASVMF